MAEPDKRQIGDGSDNYGEAAKQMAKAAKEAGIETAKQAAVKGAEAGANAAAATVQAGVEGGKAVAEIAAGTAAGGPWGAILSAAWAMRHTLFKILVCICLFFLVILNLEPDEARYVQETLKLTRTEIRAITRFERGEALISSNNNKVPVVVKASKLEKEMITTDRAELEAILKERQREKTHSA